MRQGKGSRKGEIRRQEKRTHDAQSREVHEFPENGGGKMAAGADRRDEKDPLGENGSSQAGRKQTTVRDHE